MSYQTRIGLIQTAAIQYLHLHGGARSRMSYQTRSSRILRVKSSACSLVTQLARSRVPASGAGALMTMTDAMRSQFTSGPADMGVPYP
ncbi:unnamed protein product [Miscanthus lutarioriparius]|uniref:Uncharacterized protein n=1 Tax=Miscanthus lutarioriparius TaxID=422564 RepID=A0A811S521_9POAL|nr:unnamed protein product [Miscanthus lutarioriparius]